MRLVLDSRFKKKVKGMFGKYNFEVGVLEDSQYRKPLKGAKGQGGKDVVSTYAGGPIRKKSRTNSNQRVSDVSKANRDRLGFNYLTEPFKNQSSDIVKFSREFFKLVFGRSEKRRAENLLQAIVRNPILRGEYGPQSPLTTKIKTFNRPMIDTAQLFKSIKAVCKIGGR
jgi:hypothetical protein